VASPGKTPGKLIRWSLLFAALVCAGLALSSGVDLGYLPAGTGKSILVQVEFHGAYAEEVERVLVRPLEAALARQTNIRDLFSLAEVGRCRIYIRFEQSADLNRAYLSIREAVAAVYAHLPPAVQRPLILKSGYRSLPVFIAAFPPGQAKTETALRRYFENLEGTGEIEIGGGVRREIQIAADPNTCAAMGVSVNELVGAVRRNNLLGSYEPDTRAPLLLDGRLKSPAQLKNLTIRDNVRLGELAEVRWHDAARESIGRVDGRPKTLVYVHRAGDANTVTLCRCLRRAVSRLDGQVLYDYGRRIELSLLEVLRLVVLGIGLVILLTLLFSRTVYPALLVSLNIPFAILMTLSLLRLLGREVNMMSLSGLAVGVGLVIDAGVVFCEEFLSVSGDLSQTFAGTRKIILLSAATTLAVFFPLLFAEEAAITSFGDLAVAVGGSVAASLLYVFLFLPAVLSWFFRRAGQQIRRKPGRGFALPPRLFLLLARSRMIPLLLLMSICGGAAVLLPGLRLETILPAGESRLPLILEYPSGCSLDFVFARAGPLESAIVSMEGVRHVAAKYQKERATFNITLQDETASPGVRMELRKMEARYYPAFFYFPRESEGERAVEVILTGTENSRLRELAEALGRRIAALPAAGRIVYHYKQAAPVREIRVSLRDARRQGLDPYAVYAGLYWMLSEPVAAKWTRGGKEADIRFFCSTPVSAASILNLKIAGPAGTMAEIKNVAVIEEGPGTGRITHYNRRRSVSFAVMTDSASVGELLRSIEGILAATSLPFGYHAEAGSEIRAQVRILRAALVTLGLAVGLIFLILVFGFECLRHSAFTLLQIPLAFVLPVYMLRLFSLPVSPPVIAGLILTAGVAVNNCIVILLPYGRRRLKALPLLAVLRTRLRPILIASLTTVLGVFPLMFSHGGGLLAPLSLVMAAGIAGSLPLLFLSLALFARG